MIRSQAHRWLQWVICRSCDEERPSNGHKGFRSQLSLLAAFSRSPLRWLQARGSRRRTILPACSRTRPSSLLGR